MLLISDHKDSIDPYQYKLILATLCSAEGHEKAFETLVSEDIPFFENLYAATGNQATSFIELFRHFLKNVLNIARTDEFIDISYNKLFILHVNDILTELLDAHHMDKKFLAMLRRSLVHNSGVDRIIITDANWQQVRDELKQNIRRNFKLDKKFIGEASSAFGMIAYAVEYYVMKFRSDIHSILNKTGMYEVDENEFHAGLLNIETLPTNETYEINFQAVMQAIYELNCLFYMHKEQGVDPYYYYDLISYYCKPLLNAYHKELCLIFKRSLGGVDGIRFTQVNQEMKLQNNGVKEKLKKYGELLEIVDPIVRRGLNPGDVEMYFESIYRHVSDNQSSSSASLFRTVKLTGDAIRLMRDTGSIGNFNTETKFSKMEGHDAIKKTLEGAMALHHLFRYINANKINIFDLDREVFMDERFSYRFKSVEDIVAFTKTTKALMERKENPEIEQACKKNRMPLNDDVVVSLSFKSGKASVFFDNVREFIGDVSDFGKSRKERGKKENPVYASIQAAYNNFYDTRGFLESMRPPLKFDALAILIAYCENERGEVIEQGYKDKIGQNIEIFKVNYLEFVRNIADQQDIISALEIPQLQKKGIKAQLACKKNPMTGYWEEPSYPFMRYCLNNFEVAKLINVFRSSKIESSESILEVYRACSFFISMEQMFIRIEDELGNLLKQFNPTFEIPIGYFDAYSFISKNLLFCKLKDMNAVDAIKEITTRMRTELFLTSTVNVEKVYLQLTGVYQSFMKKYKVPLDNMYMLQEMYYTDFANRLGGGYSLLGDESFFEEARKQVHDEVYKQTVPEFLAYKESCSTTLKGFLKRNGRLITQVDSKSGTEMYLHERGLWIGRTQAVNFEIKHFDVNSLK